MEHGESLALTASVEAEAKLSGESEERLMLELASLRKLLALAEDSAEVARNDRDHFLLKTMKEKQSMLDQINELNAEICKLKGFGDEASKCHGRRPKSWRPHWNRYSSFFNRNDSHEDEVVRKGNRYEKNLAPAPTAGPPVPNRCLSTFVHTEGQRVNDCTYCELLTTASNDGSVCVWHHLGARGFQARTNPSISDSASSSRSNAIPLCSIVIGDVVIAGCSDNTIK